MARNLNAFALVPMLLAVATMFHGSAAQTRHVVGDAIGWTIPSDGATTYAPWAAHRTFMLGDTLVFNFSMDAHDVAEVTKENFDSCNIISPLAIYDDPPVRLTLSKTGEHYFICAIPGHCFAGQKLAINVTGMSTATPPSSTTTTTPSSTATSFPSPSATAPSSPCPTGAAVPPPQNSKATSIGVAGISTTLLSIAAAFLY